MKTPVIAADLTLDLVDSAGMPTRPVTVGRSRLMAYCPNPAPRGMWYGFVIVEAIVQQIDPGTAVPVVLAFLDPDGARDAFPCGAVVRFGDGVVSRGSLVLVAGESKSWDLPVGVTSRSA